MTPAENEFLARFLKERSGLVLVGDKGYLIENRLGPIAKAHGLASLSQLVQKLRFGGGPALEQEVVEAMTTNETFFFRDKTPFDLFVDTMLPHLKARPIDRRIRIWCAACSTGQEPYSLAMILKERAAELGGRQFEILATDLSSEVLAKAKAGRFSQFEVQRGLPIQLLVKYFTQKEGGQWEIAQPIRDMVQWRPLNLLRDFSALGTFDIVFCRNVLIYFDEATKSDIMGRLSRAMASDGFLVLGAAETVVGLSNELQAVPQKRGLYVRAQRTDVLSRLAKAV
jgi:chemotaxis protein methyltransferase CheR